MSHEPRVLLAAVRLTAATRARKTRSPSHGPSTHRLGTVVRPWDCWSATDRSKPTPWSRPRNGLVGRCQRSQSGRDPGRRLGCPEAGRVAPGIDGKGMWHAPQGEVAVQPNVDGGEVVLCADVEPDERRVGAEQSWQPADGGEERGARVRRCPTDGGEESAARVRRGGAEVELLASLRVGRGEVAAPGLDRTKPGEVMETD